MNVTGFSIRVLSVPVNGDTRDRDITGYAITDETDTIIAEFANFGLASAAWDMIISESDQGSDEGPTVPMPVPTLPDGDARPAL